MTNGKTRRKRFPKLMMSGWWSRDLSLAKHFFEGLLFSSKDRSLHFIKKKESKSREKKEIEKRNSYENWKRKEKTLDSWLESWVLKDISFHRSLLFLWKLWYVLWNCFGKYKRHHNPSIKGHELLTDYKGQSFQG